MRSLAYISLRFWRENRGATLVELAMVFPLLLLLIFGVLEYGRLYWTVTTMQKAAQMVARITSVSPAICADVPSTFGANGGITPPPRFGELCRTGSSCATVSDQTCNLSTASATSTLVWDRIEDLLPPGATPSNILVTYSFDPTFGFVGGPYTPVITVEFTGLNFNFLLPIGPLAALAANDPSITSSSPTTISLPSMSTSVPAEDLGFGI